MSGSHGCKTLNHNGFGPASTKATIPSVPVAPPKALLRRSEKVGSCPFRGQNCPGKVDCPGTQAFPTVINRNAKHRCIRSVGRCRQIHTAVTLPPTLTHDRPTLNGICVTAA